jgi:sirohydrochlorin ferrochelatase
MEQKSSDIELRDAVRKVMQTAEPTLGDYAAVQYAADRRARELRAPFEAKIARIKNIHR